jgi:hypothetical protein
MHTGSPYEHIDKPAASRAAWPWPCTASEYKVNRAPANGAIYQNIRRQDHPPDLDAALGNATVVSFDPGYEVWVYKNQLQAPGMTRLIPCWAKKARAKWPSCSTRPALSGNSASTSRGSRRGQARLGAGRASVRQ